MLTREPFLLVGSTVGKPIHVKQNPNPTKEEIEEVQNRYIEELMK